MMQQCQIDKTCERVVKGYFDAFNRHAFTEAAMVFSPQGELYPPFESVIVGRSAIAEYLGQEASQMTAYPQVLDGADQGPLHVIGQVDAIAFRVGVEWIFSLTETSEIQSLSIRLRASMKELLTIRPV